MFLSRDNLPASSPDWLKHYEKLHNNLVKRTRQLKRANHELAHQIAERKRVEEALQQAEQKYRSIFEYAVIGIFQTTPEGNYKACNPALASIYGYEFPGELLTSLTDIGRQLYVQPQRRREFIEQLYAYDSVSEFESQVYRKDGTIIWICENARAVRDDKGTLLYYEGFVTDITQRKLAEESMRQSEAQLRAKTEQLELALSKLQQTQSQLVHNEKMSSLGQLVAGVAHEINNPVNFVCGNLIPAHQYTQDLLNLLKVYAQHYPQPVPEVQQEAEAIDLDFLIEDFPKTLSSMQLGADRIRQIVQSLQHFSRLDDAQMTPADLHKGIESTLLIIYHRLKGKGDSPGITVIKEYGDLPLVDCYPGLLNQVFMNLLCNAIDALEECNQKRCIAKSLKESCIGFNLDACGALVAHAQVSDRQVIATLETTNPPLEGGNTDLLSPCHSASVAQLSPEAAPLVDVEQYPSTIRICTHLKRGNSPTDDGCDLWAVVKIIDNGPGMTEDIKTRIFDPFFTTKPVGKGTGLGLSISHQIVVEKHGGRLRCISAPAQGTEFVIEIPIRQ
ncbi:MAG TPA: ATP-binding protein [Candidatus Sericytochromatia bacterium]|jgi:PAS domain S-box-containing protein